MKPLAAILFNNEIPKDNSALCHRTDHCRNKELLGKTPYMPPPNRHTSLHVVNLCRDLQLTNEKESLGKTAYVRPRDRHTLLRVMPLAIILLGNDASQVKDILEETSKSGDDKRGKELRLKNTFSSAMEILAHTPVTPLFGDMQHVCYNTLKLAPWFGELLQSRKDVPDWVQPAGDIDCMSSSFFNDAGNLCIATR